MNTEHKKYLLDLIEKFQSGTINSEELLKLTNFFASHQINKDWPIDENLKLKIKEQVFAKIKSEIKPQRKSKVISLLNTNVFKYAAAIILLVTTGYFLTKNQFVSKQEIVEINNVIPVGTDKATLTLEDGSSIALEKGKEFKTDDVNSNGEQIIYQSKINKSVKKLAYNFLTIPRGGEFYIVLEDGTKVWLNAETQLKYPVEFLDGQSRDVELLYGEAYFEVSPSSNHNGDKFRVKKDDQYIEVLGTEFNVKSYKEDQNIETILAEGKIALNVENQRVELIPNQQVIFNKEDKSIEVNKVDAAYLTAWKNGLFKFNDKSFEEVSKVLSRWYEVDFHFNSSELANTKVKGSLSKYQNIEYIIIALKNINDFDYKIEGDQIYIN